MTRQTRPRCGEQHVHWLSTWWPDWWAREEGRISAFVVTVLVAILALAGLTLDGGLALAEKVRANGQAEAAARAGAQALDLAAYRATGTVRLIPTDATTAAQNYLGSVGQTGIVTVTGDTVTVRITTTHHTQLLALVGIPALTVHGSGSAHPVRGVLTVEP